MNSRSIYCTIASIKLSVVQFKWISNTIFNSNWIFLVLTCLHNAQYTQIHIRWILKWCKWAWSSNTRPFCACLMNRMDKSNWLVWNELLFSLLYYFPHDYILWLHLHWQLIHLSCLTLPGNVQCTVHTAHCTVYSPYINRVTLQVFLSRPW